MLIFRSFFEFVARLQMLFGLPELIGINIAFKFFELFNFGRIMELPECFQVF